MAIAPTSPSACHFSTCNVFGFGCASHHPFELRIERKVLSLTVVTLVSIEQPATSLFYPSSATHLLPGTNGHIPQNFPIMTAHLSKLLCLPVSSQTVWHTGSPFPTTKYVPVSSGDRGGATFSGVRKSTGKAGVM